MIRGLVVSDLFIYIHTYIHIYKSFEDLRDSFSIHMFIYFIYNQVSIYVNRRSNKKTQNVKYTDDPTMATTSFDLYHGVASMFSGCPGCKDRAFNIYN